MSETPEEVGNPIFRRVDANWIRDEMVNYAAKYKISSLLETGTHVGQTCLYALCSRYFTTILSVELSDTYFEWLEQNFAESCTSSGVDISRVNVSLWHGDSRDKMPEMLSALHETAVVWLDAHDSGGDTSPTTPLIDELNMLAGHSIKDHVIMIDDIKACYHTDTSSPWPHIDDVVSLIRDINPGYVITIKYGILFAEIPANIEDYPKVAGNDTKNDALFYIGKKKNAHKGLMFNPSYDIGER